METRSKFLSNSSATRQFSRSCVPGSILRTVQNLAQVALFGTTLPFVVVKNSLANSDDLAGEPYRT
jgi:hypothetical protein